MEDRLYAGQVGMVMGRAGIIMDLYTANLTDRDINTRLIALEPPLGMDGNSGLAPIDVSRESRGFAITKSSENPEKAFELLEFFMSDEGQMLDRLGVEGREYTNGDNGELVKTDKGLTWWSRFFEVPGWESPIPPMSDNAAQALDMTKNFYSEDITYTIPMDMTSKWDEMDSLYKEYASRIIMGDYSIDKFDEFVEKWYAAGGEEITSLANQELNK
jgi:putative aldouronate transport system substrate-binding protein